MQAHEGNAFHVEDFDCGDGIPALSILPNEGAGFADVAVNNGPIAEAEAKVSVRAFALAAGVLAQIVIGLIIALGGNAAVGVVAAIAIMACSLILVIAGAMKPAN